MPLFGKSPDKEYEKAARVLADGDAEKAIKLLTEFLKKNPKHVNATVTLAVALLQSIGEKDIQEPRVEKAIALLDRAINLAPEDPVPVFNKAVLYRDLGRLEESLVFFKQALEIDERQPLVLLHIAEVNYELEQWDEAIEYARLALVRDPGLEGALGWVRDAMEKSGQLVDPTKTLYTRDGEDSASS